mmetsp:Transcript_5490/g.15561  ORF Transcript_5490/g.15561 Transcript_5490/m.15561 type:complete len:200 (-) Transcript_5490:44-643(-)
MEPMTSTTMTEIVSGEWCPAKSVQARVAEALEEALREMVTVSVETPPQAGIDLLVVTACERFTRAARSFMQGKSNVFMLMGPATSASTMEITKGACGPNSFEQRSPQSMACATLTAKPTLRRKFASARALRPASRARTSGIRGRWCGCGGMEHFRSTMTTATTKIGCAVISSDWPHRTTGHRAALRAVPHAIPHAAKVA